MFLMETRVNSNRAQSIMGKINLPNCVDIPPEGFFGGFGFLKK